MRKVTNYLKEVRLELKKVVWADRSEVIQMTLIVLITSVIVALYVGGLDVVFTKLLEQAVSQ